MAATCLHIIILTLFCKQTSAMKTSVKIQFLFVCWDFFAVGFCLWKSSFGKRLWHISRSECGKRIIESDTFRLEKVFRSESGSVLNVIPVFGSLIRLPS